MEIKKDMVRPLDDAARNELEDTLYKETKGMKFKEKKSHLSLVATLYLLNGKKY